MHKDVKPQSLEQQLKLHPLKSYTID